LTYRWVLTFGFRKGRTLEEIGTLFGDDHVASHWYGISEEERAKIDQDALKLTMSGRIPEEPQSKPPVSGVEGKDGNEKIEDFSRSV